MATASAVSINTLNTETLSGGMTVTAITPCMVIPLGSVMNAIMAYLPTITESKVVDGVVTQVVKYRSFKEALQGILLEQLVLPALRAFPQSVANVGAAQEALAAASAAYEHEIESTARSVIR